MSRKVIFPENFKFKNINIKLDRKTNKSASYWVNCYEHDELKDFEKILDFIDELKEYIHQQGFNFRLITDYDTLLSDIEGEPFYGFDIRVIPSKRYKGLDSNG